MSMLNRLAQLFGYEPKPDVNVLAQSPYIKEPQLDVRAIGGLGGRKFKYAESLANYNNPVFIGGYRYDRRKQQLETLPSKYNAESVRLFSTAIGDAIRNKVPGVAENMSPEVVTAMLLKEGRENLGTNEFNVNDPESVAIYNRYSVDYGPEAGRLIAAIYDKSKVSKRLGIPFASAWIGTGRSKYETSQQYAKDTENFKRIANNPKNRSLKGFIQSSMAPPLSGEE